MQMRGSNMVLKNLKTTNTTWKYEQYRSKKQVKAYRNTTILFPSNREGGRTVGSGRVATIIE